MAIEQNFMPTTVFRLWYPGIRIPSSCPNQPKAHSGCRNQGFDESMAQLVAHLGITWEEIFEKGEIDFYLLKTNLLRYITDGTIYFADVVYHMSVEERKEHIRMCWNWSRRIPKYVSSSLMMNVSRTPNIFSRCPFTTISANCF